ncbi:MAG: HD domain-containing protein [Saccharothrix sp.]|nr:HD domain-containing protein [Saccharothrix sp.]
MDSLESMNAEAVARSLLEDYPRRWKHVRGVAQRLELLQRLTIADERELLRSAALLHDIGYAPEIAVTGFHALDGANYLESIGVSKRLCALVAHHSCAYREAQLRGLSVELARWSDEKGTLRDALWWADMTTGPDGDTTSVHERIAEIQARYGPDDLVAVFIRQAEPELVAAVERTEARLRGAGVAVK